MVELATGREALEADASDWTAICLELGLPDMEGLDVLPHLRARHPCLPVLILSARREFDAAVQALRLGACDYLTKPFDPQRMLQVLRWSASRPRPPKGAPCHEEQESGHALIDAIIGQSGPMRALARQIRRVLHSDVPVCIFGETGTGKELIARALHRQGSRARGPFVALNCAALSESLLESELFGHERGAFTGATGSHRGCFEQAQGGTLFLDEVGEMSPATQVRLLRTLQEKTLRRVGGGTEIRVDVRVVAATHRDLKAETRAGRFREDLYYRLVVYPLWVPAVRERVGDIPLLVDHLLRKHHAPGAAPRWVSEQALEALCGYHWPGNVRDLENVIQRALLCCEGERIELGHLPEEIRALKLPALPARGNVREGVAHVEEARRVVPLQELERREIIKALEVTNGSVTAAARLLGLGRATLYRRLGELRLLRELTSEPEPSEEDSPGAPAARPAARVRRRTNGGAAEDVTSAGRAAVGGQAGAAPSGSPAPET
jgi:DNA-binding NtrC family response regulator